MKESLGMAVDSHLIVLYHSNSKDKATHEIELITGLLKNVCSTNS